MTYDEALQRVAELKRGVNNPFSITERAEIETLYFAVLGRRVRECNCLDRWYDAMIEMLCYLNKNKKMKERSKYILRAGVILQPAGTSNVYTNDNLTDEVAAAFLAERPNAVGLFEVIPILSGDTESNTNKDDDDEKTARIAELEAENTEMRTTLNELERSTPCNNLENNTDELNPNIKAAISAAMADGSSKSKIKANFAGKEIDGVKLTIRLTAAYIKAIEDEQV